MIGMKKTVLTSFTILFVLSTVFLIRFKISVEASPELPVRNIDTELDYATIQEAINANETLDGHTIFVEEGTYYEHVVVNKSLSLIGENRSTTIIDGNGTGTVVTVGKPNVNIRGFAIQKSGLIRDRDAGIFLIFANLCNITQCNITNNANGVWLHHSSNNSISGNNIIANTHLGILLHWSSNLNISANNIKSNFIGLSITMCSHNSINGNIMVNNKYNFGVYSNLYPSHYIHNIDVSNTVDDKPVYYLINEHDVTISPEAGYVALINCSNITAKNLTLKNNLQGILLAYTENSTIINNNIGNNGEGIFCYYSSNNHIYHNNFINNIDHRLAEESNNFWDNGIEGNYYWDDYGGVDVDFDGIGDTSFGDDNYPLMGVFSSYNTSLGYHVNVISNSTIEDFDYFKDNSTIKMFVSNMTSNQTCGFCRVTIPHALMNVTSIEVIIDNDTTLLLYHNYTLYDNGTHRWIYFSYPHSTHEIDIIPEFPSFLILPVFMIATLLAVIVYRRKPKTSKH